MGGDNGVSIANFALNVSIHAPTWGATYRVIYLIPIHLGFNPRPHMGGDLVDGQRLVGDVVSIHAPTWGAT